MNVCMYVSVRVCVYFSMCNNRKKTAPGPDGLPYSAWNHRFGPATLLEADQRLRGGEDAPEGFNDSEMMFGVKGASQKEFCSICCCFGLQRGSRGRFHKGHANHFFGYFFHPASFGGPWGAQGLQNTPKYIKIIRKTASKMTPEGAKTTSQILANEPTRSRKKSIDRSIRQFCQSCQCSQSCPLCQTFQTH